MSQERLRNRLPAALWLPVALLVLGDPSGAQSANDDCQNAAPINDGTYLGTTEGASVDGASVDCPSGTGPDVWYLYTATCDGTMEVDTCTSDPFDTNLSIQAPDCSGNELACNEDADGCGPFGYQSRVTAEVAMGGQYLIRVSGWQGDSGPFELRVSCQSAGTLRPSRDRCTDAILLDVPSLTRGSTVGKTYDPAGDMSALGIPRAMHEWRCGRHNQQMSWYLEPPGVWYRVLGTGNRMTARVHTEDGHGVQVFCGSCDRLTCAADEGGLTSWCSRAGQVYTLWVFAGEVDAPAEFDLSIVDHGFPCYGAVDCVPVEVVDTFVTDNGDEDGWADTHETVNLGFTVANRSGTDVTGLVARVTSGDPKIACMAEQVVNIGDLAAGETRSVPRAFLFRLNDADRAGAGKTENDEFTASLRVSFSSDQFADLDPRRCSLSGIECDDHGDCPSTDVCANKRCWISGNECIEDGECAPADTGDQCLGRCSRSGITCWRRPWTELSMQCDETLDYCVDESQELRVELDLDISGGSGRTEFFEGFESGDFGSFTGVDMNLDAGLHGPAVSDGSRCQYNDPRKDGDAREIDCWPGVNSPHAEAYFWQVVDERSYSGLRSLYMGYEISPGVYTTPVAHLEAIRTSPINLGMSRACSGIGSSACAGDQDCPQGESCLILAPELSFKHQVSLMNERWLNTGGHAAASMGVVQVQVVDVEGDPVTPWQTIEPKVNRYDSRASPWYSECFFDPIDDGSTEDDLFDYFDMQPPIGSVGARYLSVGGLFVDHASRQYLGPSSTCYPQRVFASAGDTDDPFEPFNLNGPVSGPGLRGATGPGTWVEPVFSLDRYRGRRIRMRFLVSTAKMWLPVEFWADGYYGTGEGPVDDGWWIDDVRISHTLTEPAAVTADTRDNSALAADADGDCVADDVDRADNDDQVWALPGEVLELRLFHSGGAEGTTTLGWMGCATKGATTVEYIVIAREADSCTEVNVGAAYGASDAAIPPPGFLRRFLVQAENGYGRGTLGTDSLHNPRAGCD